MSMRLLLVDDNADFLQSAAVALDGEGSSVVVGRATSGDMALDLIAKTRPDVVLADLAMPGMNGLELTRRIKAQRDPPRVVVLTLHDEPEYRTAAARAGADGFVAKDHWTNDLPGVLAEMAGDVPPSGGEA